VLQLPFAPYVLQVALPVLVSLVLLWAWLAWGPGARQGAAELHAPLAVPVPPEDDPVFDRWQTAKGLTVALALMAVFLFTDWPRDVAALVGAGVLLLSRRLHSSHVMGFVDWPLLLLFIGLFVVNAGMEHTGLAAQAVAWLAERGVQVTDPGVLLVLGVGLSNLVSNVPAVMLLLPHLGGSHTAGTALALISTLAGNLLLVGSIANLIVADLARQRGVVIDWQHHARVGVPVTLLSLAVVALWFSLAA
jgi:Na+/H+ antiporter NhaD/arsenite permease-like protein